MSGPTSSLEVLRRHIGGARGPDAVEAVARLDLADVDALAEALLSLLPRPAGDVPAYEAWPLVNARASLMSAGGRSFVDSPTWAGLKLDGGDEPARCRQEHLFHQRGASAAKAAMQVDHSW
jgi:hypothetical protein